MTTEVPLSRTPVNFSGSEGHKLSIKMLSSDMSIITLSLKEIGLEAFEQKATKSCFFLFDCSSKKFFFLIINQAEQNWQQLQHTNMPHQQTQFHWITLKILQEKSVQVFSPPHTTVTFKDSQDRLLY